MYPFTISAEKSEISRDIKIQLFYIGSGGLKLATQFLLCEAPAKSPANLLFCTRHIWTECLSPLREEDIVFHISV